MQQPKAKFYLCRPVLNESHFFGICRLRGKQQKAFTENGVWLSCLKNGVVNFIQNCKRCSKVSFPDEVAVSELRPQCGRKLFNVALVASPFSSKIRQPRFNSRKHCAANTLAEFLYLMTCKTVNLRFIWISVTQRINYYSQRFLPMLKLMTYFMKKKNRSQKTVSPMSSLSR